MEDGTPAVDLAEDEVTAEPESSEIAETAESGEVSREEVPQTDSATQIPAEIFAVPEAGEAPDAEVAVDPAAQGPAEATIEEAADEEVSSAPEPEIPQTEIASEVTHLTSNDLETSAEASEHPVETPVETTGAPADVSIINDPSYIAAAISELVDSEVEAEASISATLEALESVKDSAELSETSAESGDHPIGHGDHAIENGGPPIENGDHPASIETTVDPGASTEEKPLTNGEGETTPKVDDASRVPTVVEATAAELEAALVKSAENTASAYKSRTRRRSSVSSVDSQDDETATGTQSQVGVPSTNRLSILYEDSSRRLCFDAAVVAKVRIYRTEGKIEVVLAPAEETKVKSGEPSEKIGGEYEKPTETIAESSRTASLKGILVTKCLVLWEVSLIHFQVEMYDHTDQRFVSASPERLEELRTDPPDITIPPFYQALPSTLPDNFIITVYLNKKRPLSEPKWCRTNMADDWLFEQFGMRRASSDVGWRGKLEIMDPDPVCILNQILPLC